MSSFYPWDEVENDDRPPTAAELLPEGYAKYYKHKVHGFVFKLVKFDGDRTYVTMKGNIPVILPMTKEQFLNDYSEWAKIEIVETVLDIGNYEKDRIVIAYKLAIPSGWNDKDIDKVAVYKISVTVAELVKLYPERVSEIEKGEDGFIKEDNLYSFNSY